MPAQDWIRSVLKDRGVKLKDAAAALDIKPPRMTDILKGMREVQSDEVLPLAELLGMSSKSLLKSLEEGKPVNAGADDAGRLPILGALTGTGELLPLGDDTPISSVPIPPDAETQEGLFCYIMGDDSLDQEIRAGSIVIAGDPRVHFFPMVPGSLFIIDLGDGKLTGRQYFKSDTGEDWLVPLSGQHNPRYESWRFSMLPEGLAPTGAVIDKTDTQMPGHKIVRTDDIAAVVMWVHRRYTPDQQP